MFNQNPTVVRHGTIYSVQKRGVDKSIFLDYTMRYDDHTSATTTATHKPAAEAGRVVISMFITTIRWVSAKAGALFVFLFFLNQFITVEHFSRSVAQSGLERLVRDQEVAGSNPVTPTI